MNAKLFSEAMSEVNDKYYEEAENYHCKKHRWVKWGAMAACLCLAVFAFAVSVFSPIGGIVVTAYASGVDEEITSTGATFTTGTINDNGYLTGHPLMFHLAGESIDTVRFSCKNGQMNFIDLTEQRDEYGFAQNFTVYYGEDESDYSSLLIDWVPSNIIAALKDDDVTISDLPEDIRHDIIVMEITFANGKSITKAITISLETDGTFYAAFDEYTVLESDDFVNRADSSPISRDVLYEQGEMTVTFFDINGNEVLPETNWYITKNIDKIVVQWNGRAPEMVQMFFTPAGTETAKEMDFLQTEAISAENKVITMMRSLQFDTLEENGHRHFDSWAADFGEKVTAIELKPEGTGFRSKTRFAKFYNLPELISIWKEAADIQTADMLKLPVPEAEYITVTTEPSEFQQKMVAELGDRAEDVRNRMVDPSVDNMLRITSDGRKLALDQRLQNPLLPDDPDSKVNTCVKNLFQVWRESEEIRGTQLVFCDLSTPKGDGKFNVYDDIRTKLIAHEAFCQVLF